VATTDGAQLEDPPELPGWMAAIARIAPASAWRMFVQRLVANVIDLAGLWATFVLIPAAMMSDWLRSMPQVVGSLFQLPFVAFLSTQVIWLMRHGATIGKRIAGVRVVRRNGAPASVWRIVFLRYTVTAWVLAEAVQTQTPLLAQWLLLLDAAFVLVPGRRCLHDWLAGTDVIASRWSYSNRSAHGALSGGEPPR
jgi:uncharacterized RDD family membrane protein YckC